MGGKKTAAEKLESLVHEVALDYARSEHNLAKGRGSLPAEAKRLQKQAEASLCLFVSLAPRPTSRVLQADPSIIPEEIWGEERYEQWQKLKKEVAHGASGSKRGSKRRAADVSGEEEEGESSEEEEGESSEVRSHFCMGSNLHGLKSASLTGR